MKAETLLPLVGVLVTAYVAWQNGRIHQLVNSQFSAALAEIAVLRAHVAKLTGATEDQIRAEVAQERAKSNMRQVPVE